MAGAEVERSHRNLVKHSKKRDLSRPQGVEVQPYKNLPDYNVLFAQEILDEGNVLGPLTTAVDEHNAQTPELPANLEIGYIEAGDKVHPMGIINLGQIQSRSLGRQVHRVVGVVFDSLARITHISHGVATEDGQAAGQDQVEWRSLALKPEEEGLSLKAKIHLAISQVNHRVLHRGVHK